MSSFVASENTNPTPPPNSNDGISGDGVTPNPLPDVSTLKSRPTVHLIVGMAGSGKTTFLTALSRSLPDAYIVNLDPACMDPPYESNLGESCVRKGWECDNVAGRTNRHRP